MVLEIAEVTVRAGEEEVFARDYRQAAQSVRDSPSDLSGHMTREIESPSRFVRLREWKSLIDRTQGFRQSSFPTWPTKTDPFFTDPPRTEPAVGL